MMLITTCVFSAFFLAAFQPKSRKPQACALAVVRNMVTSAAEAARSSLFIEDALGKFTYRCEVTRVPCLRIS
jgi:hypothetical protein